jgi:hypothetical protein
LANPARRGGGRARPRDGGQNAVEHLLLADDAAPDLRQQVGTGGREALQQLDIAREEGRGKGLVS